MNLALKNIILGKILELQVDFLLVLGARRRLQSKTPFLNDSGGKWGEMAGFGRLEHPEKAVDRPLV